MMRGIVRAGATILALGALSACGSSGDEDGFGALTVSDLDNPPIEGHFTGSPEDVDGTLGLTHNGCVTVTVDGVARVAFWPAGTTVEDHGGTYTIDIPDRPDLHAAADSGDTFHATAVVDETAGDFVAKDGSSDGKAAQYLTYCAVDAAPIAFFDAGSIAPSTA